MERTMSPKEVDFEENEEEGITQQELQFDVEDTLVQVVDGVAISNDDELIKLLFYYFKPGENPETDDKVECKAVAEFRISQKGFLGIVKELNNKAKGLRRYHKKLTDFMYS